MANQKEIADVLAPLVDDIDELMRSRDEHDPLALVRGHLTTLIASLRGEAAPLKKMEVLAQLGFLKEHSVRDDLASFHATIEQAIEAAMQPGWE